MSPVTRRHKLLVRVHVNPNGAPTADSQNVSTNEDTPLDITLTGSDPDNGQLMFTVVTNPTHGTLSGAAPNLTYTPAANYNGSDSFTFQANDGMANSNIATVSITVTAVNDPPTISNIPDTSINEDTDTGAIGFTVGDVETAAPSLIVSGTSSNTTLVPNTNIVFGGSGANRTVTITPVANANGTTTITVSVNDGTDTTSDTFVLTVNAVNDAPTADDQSVATNQNTSLPITLSGSDLETPPASLTFSVTVPPAHGTLTGTAPNVTYNPTADYHGSDSFKFTVTDTGDGASPPLTSAEATVSITINDAPVATPQTVTTNEDTAIPITLTGSDPNGDMLSYVVVTNPTHGALSGTAPNLTYTPAANYNGDDSFTFKVSDGMLESDPAMVAITVNAVNDPPTISDIPDTSIDEDTNTGAIGFTVGDVETPGSLTVSGTSSNTTLVPNANIVFGGSGANRTVTITPAANANGTTTITVSVNDGTDTTSDTFLLTVNPVNDAPTADDQSVATTQNTSLPITLTGSDLETPPANLTFNVTVPPAHGTLSGTGPNVTYNPATDYHGSDSFRFTVTDTGDGASPPLTSAEATVSITINDPPTATPQAVTTDEDTAAPIILTGSDPNGDMLSFIVVTNPTHGVLSGTAPI